MRYTEHRDRVVNAVSASPGHRAAVAKGDPAVARFVEKVVRYAYQVTDGDIEALKRAGHDEDAIFEITVSAAVSAGLVRLERGLAALRGAG